MTGNQFMAMKEIIRAFQKENPENARKFFDFICSPTCQQIYKDFGFLPDIGG
jgi:ABC-type Fe3+ transport system substrate-binding protein